MDELAGQYQLVRLEQPDAEIEDIVAIIAERIGPEAEIDLAAESLAADTGVVDVIRGFVYSMEEDELDEEEDEANGER